MKTLHNLHLVIFQSVVLIHGAAAADTYTNSLKAGDDARKTGNTTSAFAEYDAALTQAATPTERALAIGKKAAVIAYDTKEYARAKKYAEEALAIPDIQPIARVTALQVLAECQMKDAPDFTAAAKSLTQALDLQGVDWAKPWLLMSLGDCRRQTGEFTEALACYNKVLALPDAANDAKAVANLNTGLTQQYNLKDGKAAREAYAKAVAINPALQAEVTGHLAKLPATDPVK